MIKAYKIKYLSPHTNIKSYTLFGAFCWGYRFLKGNNRLEKFLKDFKKEPKFLISSPFPLVNNNFLFPKPDLILKEDTKIPVLEKLKRKPYKKAKYITEEVLKDIIKGKVKYQNDKDIIKGEVKYQNDLMQYYKSKGSIIYKENEEIEKINYREILFTHNSLNRITNSSESLYFEKGIISNEEFFLVRFLDESFKNEFEEVLNIIKDLGLGGNKNIGWGKVKIEPVNKNLSFLENSPKSNQFLTLSPVIPTKNLNTNNSFYNIFSFKSYSESSFSKGELKNKVIYLDESSIIYAKDKNKFVGQLKKVGFFEENKPIYQYGFEFPIYLEWSYERKN